VSGTDVVLVACVRNDGTGEADETTTAVTWNDSESFTKIVQQGDGEVDGTTTSWWALVAPTQTTENVDVTIAEASTSIVHVITITGAAQSLPTLSNTGSCSDCTTVEVDLTSTVNDTLMLMCAGTGAGGDTYTHGEGQTELTDLANPNGNVNSSSTSFEVRAVAGTETLSSSIETSRIMRAAAIGITEPAAPPATTRRRRAPRSFQ
jgi:hypothetical protein